MLIQQTSSVAEYMVQFESLMNEVEGQSKESLIIFFLGGLQQEIKKIQ